MITYRLVLHDAGLGHAQPETRVAVKLLDGDQEALERFLGAAQMEHGHAQVVEDLAGSSRTHGLQRALT